MNGAEILRQAAYEEGYKAGKQAAVKQIFEDLNEFLEAIEAQSENKRLKETGDWILHEYLPNQLAELKKKYEEKEMSEVGYYVIKNPDTGLYFRGKGVNRWGKYFNQASIYRIKGQVEESCDWINKCHRNGERAIIVPIKIIEQNSEI